MQKDQSKDQSVYTKEDRRTLAKSGVSHGFSRHPPSTAAVSGERSKDETKQTSVKKKQTNQVVLQRKKTEQLHPTICKFKMTPLRIETKHDVLLTQKW